MFDIFRQGGSKFASRQRVALDRVTQDLAEAEARIAPLEQRLGEASLAGEDTGAIEAELATARRLVDTKRHAVRAAEIAEEKRLAAKLADDEAKRLAAEARENAKMQAIP